MVKRIAINRCCGVIVDVQEFFLSQLEQRLRSRIVMGTADLIRLLDYFDIPLVVTLERPVEVKGRLPDEISTHLGSRTASFEKDFFDLTKEPKIKGYLGQFKRKQMIVAGCETDVCVLQSCLGLLSAGYEVFVVEDLLFSSSPRVESALARMKTEGATFLTYKTLYYELLEAVDGGRHAQKRMKERGPLPEDIPDSLD